MVVSGKNYWLTLFLCFFLGVFGIHRMYVGRWFTGLIQFFTAGGFFIWTLIDLILIALGKFKDSNGFHLVSPYHLKKNKVERQGQLPEHSYTLDLPHPNDIDIEEFTEVVNNLNPHEAAEYFKQMDAQDVRFGTEKYKVIAEKGGAFYEEDLLEELRDVEGDEVDDWLMDVKNQGMLVSKKVWKRAKDKSERYWND